MGAALITLAACGGGGGSGGDGDGEPETGAPPGVPARVEIVQTGLVFTAAGESRQLEARLFDAAGNRVSAPLSWESSDAGISISAAGLARAVEGNGSAQIVARSGELRSPPLLGVIATVAPGTLVVTDAQVVSAPVETAPEAVPDPANTYSVVLSGIAAPAVGSLLVGNGSQPIAGRVVAAESVSGGVKVTLRLAPIRELFPRLEINEVIDLSQVEPVIPPEVTEAYDVVREGNTLTFTGKVGAVGARRITQKNAVISEKAADGDTVFRAKAGTPQGTRVFQNSCDVETSNFEDAETPPIEVKTLPKFSVTLSPTLDLVYTESRGLERFVAKAAPTFTFQFQPTITAAFEGKIACKQELYVIPLPFGGPISLLMGGVLPVGVGVELAGKLTVAQASIGITSSVATKVEAGVACASGSCEFVRSMSNFVVTHTPKVELPGLDDLRFEPSLSAFGYAEVALGSRFFKSLRFKALEVKIGPGFEANLAPRATQIAAGEYKSDYKLKLGAEAGTGSDLLKAFALLGIDTVSVVKFKADLPLAESPTGTATSNKASFAAGDVVQINVEMAADKREFLGFYNIGEILLMEKQPDGSFIVRVRRPIASGGSNFDLSFTAPAAGRVSDYYVFVVTKLLPTDLLALEVDRVRSGGVANLLRAYTTGYAEVFGGERVIKNATADSVGASLRERYEAQTERAAADPAGAVAQGVNIVPIDDTGLFSLINQSCNGDAAIPQAVGTRIATAIQSSVQLVSFQVPAGRQLNYQLDLPRMIVDARGNSLAQVIAFLIQDPDASAFPATPGGNFDQVSPRLPLKPEDTRRQTAFYYISDTAGLNTDDPQNANLRAEEGSRRGVLGPGTYTLGLTCTGAGATLAPDVPTATVFLEQQSTFSLFAVE